MWTTDTLTLVETFIRRLHNGDIVVSSEASLVHYNSSTGLLLPLSDCLANSISAYEARKLDIEHLLYYADSCLNWINIVIARGFIREGSGLFSKMRGYEEENGRLVLENKQLKEEKDKLQKENKRLNKKNKALDETLSRFGKGGNISDVSGGEDE